MHKKLYASAWKELRFSNIIYIPLFSAFHFKTLQHWFFDKQGMIKIICVCFYHHIHKVVIEIIHENDFFWNDWTSIFCYVTLLHLHKNPMTTRKKYKFYFVYSLDYLYNIFSKIFKSLSLNPILKYQRYIVLIYILMILSNIHTNYMDICNKIFLTI